MGACEREERDKGRLPSPPASASASSSSSTSEAPDSSYL